MFSFGRAFDAGQRDVLEQIATGASLPDVLARIVRLIEGQASDMLCSVLLLDEEGRRIASGVSPRLPPTFMAALVGAEIGPQAGSCGTAAYRRERVIVEDIATHPYWEAYRHLALPYGLRACWSSPIFDEHRQVLGTFAMYYREPRPPTRGEIGWVDAATHLCAVAILHERSIAERKRLVDELRERVKELTLLHQTARLLQSGRRFDDAFLSELVRLFPAAWQHPHLGEARIIWDGVEFATPGWRDTPWMRSAPFHSSHRQGLVQVAYREAPADGRVFLPEEDQLIRSVADMLSTHLAREETQLALQQSEDRLRAVIEHTPNVAIQWYDANGRLLFWNRASERLYGWSAAAAYGRTLDELNFSREETERFLTVLRQVAATGQPSEPTEFRFQRSDGTSGASLSTLFQIPSADGPCFVCMDVDVTERRRMEATVRASERLRSLIYSSVGDVIFYLAVEPGGGYRFLSVNPAFLAATGLTEEQVVGRTVNEVIPEPSRSLAISKYRQAIAERRPVSWDETTVYPAGVKYGEVTVAPVFDESGTCTNLVGSVHDVTARKRAEDERHALESQLHHAQRIQALGTLTGGIAHDFNNILTAIDGHTELALDGLPADHPVRAHLEEIQRAHRRATSIVRQVLTFARRQPPERGALALNTTIEEVLALIRATLPTAVHLKVRLSRDLPEIAADSTQVHQAVVNLITNAAYAISSGASNGSGSGAIGGSGIIEVATDLVDVGPGSLPEAPDLPPGRYARLSVSDNGSGMDEATLARVFEPFFTTKPVGVGTGLGLSVVHGIMKSHEGAIAVSSRPGKGTSIQLYFPASTRPARTDAQAAAPAMPALNHILYVDDETALVYLAQRFFTRLGYRVTGHSDPREALRDFRDRPTAFDAVITDLTMPSLSGSDLAREILAIRPDVPIVMMSGYVRPEDASVARRLGVGDILLKPGTVDELGRSLLAALAARAGSGRTPAN